MGFGEAEAAALDAAAAHAYRQTVAAAVRADGTGYPSAGRWRGREIVRVSVSAGPVTLADGERTAEAIVAAWGRVRG